MQKGTDRAPRDPKTLQKGYDGLSRARALGLKHDLEARRRKHIAPIGITEKTLIATFWGCLLGIPNGALLYIPFKDPLE